MDEFENFLLNESRVFLSTKIGDILNSLQNLNDDVQGGLSRRSADRAIVKITDNVRKILHGSYEDTEKHALEDLQRIAVGLLTGLENTEVDLASLVSSAAEEIEGISSKLEEPLNSIGSDKEDKKDDEENNNFGELGTE